MVGKRRSKEEIAVDIITKEVKEQLFTCITSLPPEHGLRLLNAIGVYCMTQRLRIIKRMQDDT